MDYEYDVFFSYKRDDESDKWHRTLMEKLTFWLKLELSNPDVAVFIDIDDVRTGAIWRNKLAHALRVSKTMVCVWSPLYFQSAWCVSEWKTFAERESRFKLDLVAPASYHDGACFPHEAKAKQMIDLSNFTSISTRFWDTELAVEFDTKCLKPFAKDIAALVRMAPPFDPDFPFVEVQQLDLPPSPVIGRIARV